MSDGLDTHGLNENFRIFWAFTTLFRSGTGEAWCPGTISIIDTGSGMSKSDVTNSLGNVAKSGTTALLEAMAEAYDANLIVHFGVGFKFDLLAADAEDVMALEVKVEHDPDTETASITRI